jgi:hypothetical protein
VSSRDSSPGSRGAAREAAGISSRRSSLPRNAGALGVNITRGQDVLVNRTFAGLVRIKLDTRRLTAYRIRTEVMPNEGYADTARCCARTSSCRG